MYLCSVLRRLTVSLYFSVCTSSVYVFVYVSCYLFICLFIYVLVIYLCIDLLFYVFMYVFIKSALTRPENHSKFDDHKIAARPGLADQVEGVRV